MQGIWASNSQSYAVSQDRREDTRLQLSHFRPHKRIGLKKVPRKTTNYPFHKPEENHPPGKDSPNKISNIIGKAANYAASAKSKKPLPYIPTITNYTQLWWVPNVVVAHQKEGIEAVHLASGRTLCKLHLREGGLHADINGDGVLDHVQEMERSRLLLVDQWKCCDLVGRLQLLLYQCGSNSSMLLYVIISHLFQHGEFSTNFGHTSDVSYLEVATPIPIPRSDGHRHRKGSGDVVFLTNRGEVLHAQIFLLHHHHFILSRLTWP